MEYRVIFPATSFVVDADSEDQAELEGLRQRDMYEEQSGTDAEIGLIN